jgi:hypothetical protein
LCHPAFSGGAFAGNRARFTIAATTHWALEIVAGLADVVGRELTAAAVVTPAFGWRAE